MRTRISTVTGSPVVVVSGAASGIGKDASLFLNQLGYLVAAGVRREEDGEKLRSEAVVPTRLAPLIFDVTSDDQVDAARQRVEKLVQKAGHGFAGLFSNAGIAHFEGDTSSEGTPLPVLDRVMAVNFFGAVRFIRAFLPRARRSSGTIVVNSALMARTVLPFNGGYAASKCALEGWVDSLRREAGPLGVRVVLIEAADISTGLVDSRSPVSDDNPYPVQKRFLETSFQRMAAHQDDPRCSPRRVSELVAHALQARRPRARYRVGGLAHAISAVGRLPDEVQDRLLQRLVSASSH